MAVREPSTDDRPGGVRDEWGDLLALIEAHKAELPGEDSHVYHDPTADDAEQMLVGLERALAGDLAGAAEPFDRLAYELLRVEDAVTGDSHLLLRERRPIRRGWPLLLLNLGPARAATIQVPHPIWDALSPELGIELYRRLGARHFLMAGAHRWARGRGSQVSDVARNPDSMFQHVHRGLSDPQTAVFQVHGFQFSNYPDYPDVVLSNGSPHPAPELFDLGAAIERRGERAGVFDGQHWAGLGATRNPQGRHTRAIGGRFFHLELRYRIRRDPARRAALAEAIEEAVFGSEHPSTPSAPPE